MGERVEKRPALTPKALEENVQRYIDYCAAEDEPPESYNLRRVCGISEEELDRVRERGRRENATRREREMAETVRRLDEFRTAFWLKKAIDNPRLASFAVFNLRQPRNGGYTDRAQSGGPAEIVVKLDGVGEEAFD